MGVEYFGHANKYAFVFDYSNDLDAGVAEPHMLHVKHLKKMKRSIFAKDALSTSWGCHSGEGFSLAWHRYTKTYMAGAVGKTDYSNGLVPVISTKDGYWTNGIEKCQP